VVEASDNSEVDEVEIEEEKPKTEKEPVKGNRYEQKVDKWREVCKGLREKKDKSTLTELAYWRAYEKKKKYKRKIKKKSGKSYKKKSPPNSPPKKKTIYPKKESEPTKKGKTKKPTQKGLKPKRPLTKRPSNKKQH